MGHIKKLATTWGEIHVEESGRGEPLLLVHGLLSSSESFYPVRKRLEQKRKVVAFDFPGHGKSTPSKEFSPTWDGHCDVLREVFDQLGLSTVDLLGHSMGGGVCSMFAGSYPQRVNKLILLDSITASFRLPVKARIPLIPLIGDVVFKVLYGERMFLRYFRNDVFFDPAKMNIERTRRFYTGFDEYRDSTLKTIRNTANSSSVSRCLPAIESETLVLWGRCDPLIPLYVANETVRKIKRARLQIIDDCGHSPMEECPVETADIILDFLD